MSELRDRERGWYAALEFGRRSMRCEDIAVDEGDEGNKGKEKGAVYLTRGTLEQVHSRLERWTVKRKLNEAFCVVRQPKQGPTISDCRKSFKLTVPQVQSASPVVCYRIKNGTSSPISLTA